MSEYEQPLPITDKRDLYAWLRAEPGVLRLRESRIA